MIQRIKDLWLEIQIRRALKNRQYREALQLIGQRSPGQVQRMERERGLA